jgi:HEAT repeat protein
MSGTSPRPAALRTALATLLLLTLLPGTTLAQQPPAADPVEAVRQALQGFGPDPATWEAAQKQLDEYVKKVHGVNDLGRALVLDEWRGGLVRVEGVPNPKGRDDIAARFEKALGDLLTKDDATRQCAAATLFAEVARDDAHRAAGARGGDPFASEVLKRLLPKVAELARSKDTGVREATARALGRVPLEPGTTIAAVGRLLDDPEGSVKRAAAEALARQARGGDPPPGYLTVPYQGQVAILEACTAVVPAAARGVQDRDPNVSGPCVEAIKLAARELTTAAAHLEQSAPGFPPPVRPTAGDKPGGERDPAPQQLPPFLRPADALGDGAAALVPLLASDSAGRRVEACQALEAIAAARARLLRIPGVSGALTREVGGGKGDAMLAGLKKAVPDLARCAAHKDVEVRLAALYVLEDLGPEAAPAAAATAKALADADPFVRWAAARVLGKMAPAEPKTAVPALAVRVGDENGDVRITALAALERYGRAAAPAVKDVGPVLKDGDEQTRLWAIRALAAIGPEAREGATAALIGVLTAKEPSVRRAAAAALARYGKPDPATTAALRAALQDDDAEVRRTASRALLAE